MTIGTKSVLYGAHQFIIHPFVVLRAWVCLYGWPNLYELLAILVHDLGYIGKDNIDGCSGKSHPILGARIVRFLTGWTKNSKYYEELCLYHSRSLAKEYGKPPSKLCWADKLSVFFENKSFYLFRTRLTGELLEYRNNASLKQWVSKEVSDSVWFDSLVKGLCRVVAKELK